MKDCVKALGQREDLACPAEQLVGTSSGGLMRQKSAVARSQRVLRAGLGVEQRQWGNLENPR